MNDSNSLAPITIKKLTKAEVPDFFAVIKKLRAQLSKKDLQKRLTAIERIPGHYFWGAIRGNQKVGFCHASINVNLSPGGKDIYLNDLIVAENDRSGGVGSKLLGEVQKIAKLKGCKRILVTVRTDNLTALNFYRKKGFGEGYGIRLAKES